MKVHEISVLYLGWAVMSFGHLALGDGQVLVTTSLSMHGQYYPNAQLVRNSGQYFLRPTPQSDPVAVPQAFAEGISGLPGHYVQFNNFHGGANGHAPGRVARISFIRVEQGDNGLSFAANAYIHSESHTGTGNSSIESNAEVATYENGNLTLTPRFGFDSSVGAEHTYLATDRGLAAISVVGYHDNLVLFRFHSPIGNRQTVFMTSKSHIRQLSAAPQHSVDSVDTALLADEIPHVDITYRSNESATRLMSRVIVALASGHNCATSITLANSRPTSN